MVVQYPQQGIPIYNASIPQQYQPYPQQPYPQQPLEQPYRIDETYSNKQQQQYQPLYQETFTKPSSTVQSQYHHYQPQYVHQPSYQPQFVSGPSPRNITVT